MNEENRQLECCLDIPVLLLYEDLPETILATRSASKSLFSFISVFSRVTTECYCDAAFGETRGHGAVLQESHGRSGTLAHHQKQGQVRVSS